MLLTEFDPTPRAVINPDFIHKPVEHFPETVISVFSHRLFASVAALLEGQVIAETHDADGVWPVYAVHYREKRLGFCKARVGAPACVGQFEDIIAMGAKRIILLGNCGVLDRKIEDCGIIIPTKAIRDGGYQLPLPTGGGSDRRQYPLHSRIYRSSPGIWVSLCAGRCLDDGRLLSGDPRKGRRQAAHGRGVRGDGVRGHAGRM